MTLVLATMLFFAASPTPDSANGPPVPPRAGDQAPVVPDDPREPGEPPGAPDPAAGAPLEEPEVLEMMEVLDLLENMELYQEMEALEPGLGGQEPPSGRAP